MLLQTLPLLGNDWCNNCNLINRFMKGVFYQKPPLPRYQFTWNVSVVLKFLSGLFPLQQLSLKLLTFKLVALLDLSAAPRTQTLANLHLDYMCKENFVITFTFPQLLNLSHMTNFRHFQTQGVCRRQFQV